MTVQSILARARERTQTRFTETFNVVYGERVLDEETGEYTTAEVVVHSDVPGQFKFPTMTVQEREQGAQVPASQDITIKVAVGSTPDVEVGHMWRCTASTVDASLVGRVMRTKGLPQGGQTTAHRYPVEAVS